MKFKSEIHSYIESHKGEIIETLKEMIKIPSVKGEASEEFPNGLKSALKPSLTTRKAISFLTLARVKRHSVCFPTRT